MGFVLLKDANNRLENFHLTQAKYQAKTLAEGSLDALVTQDFELLERWVASAMPSKEYAYAALVKPNGIVLTHTNIDLIGHQVFTLNDLDSFHVRQTSINNRPVIEVIYPAFVGSRHLANAHVAYYIDMKHGFADETVPWITLATVFSLVVITLGSFFLSRKIINPINYLTNIVSDFSPEKELSIEAKISGRSDEVGALARTFNSMSTRLFDAYRQLKLKSEELEKRVKERTRELLDSNQYLKESETRIAAIVDNIADGVITVDSFGIIESCNLAALQIFGYSNTELVGTNFSILFPGYVKIPTNRLKANSQSQETTAVTKDSKQFPIEYNVSEICINSKNIYIFVMRDITERKATFENLQHIANHDTLTGLYNRGYLYETLERTLARIKRGASEACAILYIDLDNFKYVNDTLGHAAGDRVLTEVTQIMTRRVRASDVLCRLGGDEFAALIFNTNAKIAKEIADTFRQKLADYIFQDGNVKVDVGCSIGISMITKDCTSADEELAHADYACYQAKRSGRNCVRMFDQEDKTHISAMSLDVSWSRRIKSAIEKDGFQIDYQPIMKINSGEINTFEVLLRMQDVDGKVIPPSGFLPAAERFGLTISIDMWVIRRVIDILAQQCNSYPHLRFSINLSPTSLLSEDLLENIEKALSSENFLAEKLTFEVTENVVFTDIEKTSKQLSALKNLGCKIALDDFGSRYASFSYLEQLPLDILKLDGRYIRNLEQNESNLKMVTAVGQIGRALGIETIAECVEKHETLVALKNLGIDYVQGYYIGKPSSILSDFALQSYMRGA